jgi:hypothetical protein
MGSLDTYERAVLREAKRWWIKGRPMNWTEGMHLGRPDVGAYLNECLASAVAALVKARKSKNGARRMRVVNDERKS